MKFLKILTFNLVFALFQASLLCHSQNNPATIAVPKKDNGRFLQMHASFLKRSKQGPVGLLFLGDSITEGWNKAPQVWKQYYDKYLPANFGIGGDRIEHVLWRIENGELNGISPKVVVLMIGTNNLGSNKAAQVVEGNKKIVQEIRTRLPQSKILLLGIFPRGPRKTISGGWDDGVGSMAKINAINPELAKLDDGRTVRYLDLTQKFLVNGKIPSEWMPDQLHPNAKGYEVWAKGMQPLLQEMML